MTKRAFIIGLVIVAVLLVPQFVAAQTWDDSFITLNRTGVNASFYMMGTNITDSLIILMWFSLLPGKPTDFTITQIGTNSINITWTKGLNADTTVIRARTDRYASGVADGYEVYNGSGTWVEIDGLTLDSIIYYYRAWSYNSYGYSIFYAQANTGGDMQAIWIFGLLFLMAGTFMGFYLWKREMWLGIAAGVAWTAIAIYVWVGYEAPTEEMTTMWFGLGWLFLALGLALLVAPMSWNKTKDEIWEESFDPDTGEPIMEEYKQGNRTGRTRPLTDLEMKEKQQPEEQRKRNKPSQFSQNGRI